jgi:hypothetical protein
MYGGSRTENRKAWCLSMCKEYIEREAFVSANRNTPYILQKGGEYLVFPSEMEEKT